MDALLYLRELRGSIYEARSGWPRRMVAVRGARHAFANSIGRTHLDQLERALRTS